MSDPQGCLGAWGRFSAQPCMGTWAWGLRLPHLTLLHLTLCAGQPTDPRLAGAAVSGYGPLTLRCRTFSKLFTLGCSRMPPWTGSGLHRPRSLAVVGHVALSLSQCASLVASATRRPSAGRARRRHLVGRCAGS